MGKLRIKEPVVLYDATIESHVVPHPTTYYDESDGLVKQHRWAFGTDEEIAELRQSGVPADGVLVESATAAPGEKRSVKGRS